MARTNWEDSIYKHPMFPKLIIKLGNEYTAKGMLLTAFELAQTYWLEHRAIPSEKWPEDMNILFEFKFATVETRENAAFIYVSGSKEHCAFLEKQSENGKKGGRSKSPAKLRNLKQNQKSPKPNRSQTETTTETKPKPTEVSYSSSISISNSFSSSDSDSTSDSVCTSYEQKTKSFIAAYCERFKFKYGTNPEIQGKDAGLAKTISKSLTGEKAELYLDAFFAMPDAGLVKAKHPLSLFQLKLNEIVVFANTGNFTTQRQANQADDMASNQLLLQKVRRGAG